MERERCGRSEGEPMPKEPVMYKSIPEEPIMDKPVMDKSIPEEPIMDKSVAGKSMSGKSMANKRMTKSMAAEREGTASHEVAVASKAGPTKAAKAPTTKATHVAEAAHVPTTKAATTKATVYGRRTQGRGTRDDRHSGEPSHYIAHHDALLIIRRRTPAFKCKTPQFPLSCSGGTVACCSDSGTQAPRIKANSHKRRRRVAAAGRQRLCKFRGMRGYSR